MINYKWVFSAGTPVISSKTNQALSLQDDIEIRNMLFNFTYYSDKVRLLNISELNNTTFTVNIIDISGKLLFSESHDFNKNEFCELDIELPDLFYVNLKNKSYEKTKTFYK